MANKTINLDEEKARPLGNTGDGETGVNPDEQGISNRPGDEDVDEFDDDDEDNQEDEDEEDGEESSASR